jgi:hypothetical protein
VVLLSKASRALLESQPHPAYLIEEEHNYE